MPYSLEPTNPLSLSVRRLAAKEIGAAEACLAPDADFHVGVHNARKGLKRLRALLWLIRPGLPEPLFEHLEGDLRAIGRELAPARDAQALVDTIERIAQKSPKLATSPTIGGLRAWLHDRRDEAEERTRTDPAANAVHGLERIRPVFAQIAVSPDNFKPLAQGLKATYRSARKGLRRSVAEPSDERVHEWRKSVQLHWRQTQLLIPCWPEALNARANYVHNLAQLLGDDHDLANLLHLLAAPAMSFGGPDDAKALAKQCRKEQRALRAEAQSLGSRLFAERPKDFTARIAAHWYSAAKNKKPSTPKPLRNGAALSGNVVRFGPPSDDSDVKMG